MGLSCIVAHHLTEIRSVLVASRRLSETDIPSYVSTVSSKLRQDPTIDSVITLGLELGVRRAEAA